MGTFLSIPALILVLSCAFASQAQAWSGGLQDYIAQLKDIPANYQVDGAICEQIARLELYEDYSPEAYEIEVNIVYGMGHLHEGELDVVVFEKYTGRAVLVGEVKCSNDSDAALSKGNKQKRRFFENLHLHGGLNFHTAMTQFPSSLFLGLQEFILIGPRGTRGDGFERELRLSLSELRDLSREMIACQKAKLCAGY